MGDSSETTGKPYRNSEGAASAGAAPPAERCVLPGRPGSTTPSSRTVSSASRANSRVAFDSGRPRCWASAIVSYRGSAKGAACRPGGNASLSITAPLAMVSPTGSRQLQRRLDVLDLDHRFQPQPGQLRTFGELAAGRVLPPVVRVVQHQVAAANCWMVTGSAVRAGRR